MGPDKIGNCLEINRSVNQNNLKKTKQIMTTFMLFLSRSSRRAADSFLFYCFQWLYSRIAFAVYLELLLNILKSVVSLPSESKTAHSHYKEICEI